MLEKAPVKFVGRSQILLQKPFSIARHIVHGVELIAQKTGTHQTDAFLRQMRTDWMELPKMRRTSERSAMFPITFRRASRQQDSSRRPSGSRKSPSPKSTRLARRSAVSINSSGGMRRLTLPLSIAPNRLRARMAIGERRR